MPFPQPEPWQLYAALTIIIIATLTYLYLSHHPSSSIDHEIDRILLRLSRNTLPTRQSERKYKGPDHDVPYEPDPVKEPIAYRRRQRYERTKKEYLEGLEREKLDKEMLESERTEREEAESELEDEN